MRDIASRNATNRQALEDLAAADRLPLEVLDLDVTDDRSVESAVQEALRRAGRLDVVINNAGIAGIGVTEAYTPAQFEGMFDVNVFDHTRNRAVLPSMRAQGSGLLIHVSSGAGRLVVPAMAASVRASSRSKRWPTRTGSSSGLLASTPCSSSLAFTERPSSIGRLRRPTRSASTSMARGAKKR